MQQNPIKFAKVDMYRYRMADPLWTIISKWLRGEEMIWWMREFEEVLIRPLRMQADSTLAYANVYDLHGNSNG